MIAAIYARKSRTQRVIVEDRPAGMTCGLRTKGGE
jgi:hypothetical protein